MLHVVLYEPEIPANTGNIMRTCAAFGCKLHLIEPLGFSLDEKHLRRAGMDYIKNLDYKIYSDWATFYQENNGEFFFLTRYGKKTPTQYSYVNYDKDIYLVFGKESTGIAKEILKNNMERCIRIPMKANARSLNLSNCVAICVFLVMDQLSYPLLSRTEVLKGEDFLKNCE